MLTIGYIGNGKSANRYHLPFVRQRENIKVKAIYDRHPDVIKWPRIPGIHYTADLDSILNDPDIELIVVCTPVMHYEYAMMALNHHKNVLVEKPFTDTVAQAEEIFAKAKAENLFAECYQNRRYDSDFLTVQKVIASGKLGDLIEIEMSFDYFRPEVPQSVQSASYTQGMLYGHGCHTLDQVISYFGIPQDVTGSVRSLLGKGRLNDYFDLDLDYNSFKVAVRSSYFRIKPRPSFVVYGQKGMFEKAGKDRQEEHLKLFYMPDHPDFGIDLPQHYGTLTYMDDDGVYHEEKVVSEKGDYGRVYDAIYAHLKQGAPRVVKPEQTLAVMNILERFGKKL